MALSESRRAYRAKQRSRNKQRHAALQARGMIQVCGWVSARTLDQIGQRAQALDVHRNTVWRAAVEVGLRHLTTSDVIRTDQAWKGILGLPVAARYPGERTDPSKSYVPPKKAQATG